MKKGLVLLAVAALALISCNKEDQKGQQKDFKIEAVDLGLDVKWANCNLEATSLEGYGGYYQWAGTTDVSDESINLDWSFCPYHKGTESYSGWEKYITKSNYGTVDNKSIIEDMDDAARSKLGEGWHIPTIEEWNKLLENCKWEWKDNYNGSGVSGILLTSTVEGYTDKSIFLPAAGYREEKDLKAVNEYGTYWSSSISESSSNCGQFIQFRSVGHLHASAFRYQGKSIRPVKK